MGACQYHWRSVTEAGGSEALGKVGAQDVFDARVLGEARLATPSAQHYGRKSGVADSQARSGTYDREEMTW